jgi:F-type H+-transporting ATPase subunit delta
MNDSRIAARYAKALFSSAGEKKLTGPVRDDLLLLAALREESAEFRLLLESPVLRGSDKIRFFRDHLGASMNQLTLEFMTLLISHKRELYLPMVCRMYQELFKEAEGILEARVESAVPMSAEILDQLREKLARYTKARIDLKQETNEELIGGFVLTLEDQQLDASVAAQLRRFKKELQETRN